MAQPEIPGGPAHPPLEEQPVVRTTASQSRRARSERRLAEIAERAAQREESESEDSELPSEQPEVISAGTLGDVPPSEPNPRRRREASLSEVVADSDTGRENRRFTDLFADFEIGNGQYYITVERIEPKMWEGVPVRGELPEIWKVMSWDDFKETYGGHRYELIVYCQKAVGQKPKRCSKPISAWVPDYDPVIDVVTQFGKDESTMVASQIPGRGGRAASNADARMFETSVQAEERREARREQERKEHDAALRRSRAEGAQEVQREASLAVQLLQGQLQEKGKELKELREKLDTLLADDERKGSNTKDFVEVAKVMRPSAEETKALHDLQEKLTGQHHAEVQRLTESSTAEIKRLTERHQDELRAMREQHAGEIKRLEDRNIAAEATAAARVSAAETRATERIAAVEAHAVTQLNDAKERIKEVETRMEKSVAEAKLDGDRRVQDIQNRHTERVQDIERAHKREIESVRERWELQVKGETGSWQSRLDVKDAEIARLRSDLDEARKEANKPLASRISEFATAAEAIGYSKDGGGGEEPKDWKQTGLEILGNVASNFPEILRAAGDTLAKAKNPAAPAQRQQFASAPQVMAPPMQQNPALPPAVARRRGGFATEDGPDFEGPVGTRAPIYPGAAPAHTPQRPPAPVMAPQPAFVQEGFMPEPQQPAPVVQQPVPITGPMVEAPPAAPVSVPAPAPQPSVPPPAAASPAGNDTALDAQILQLRPLFEGAYEQHASPDDLANYCISNFGKPQVAMILQMGITPERILMAMQRGGFAASRLCRRDGQKFLRDTFTVLKGLAA